MMGSRRGVWWGAGGEYDGEQEGSMMGSRGGV